MTDGPTDPGTVHADPVEQFRAWFADARAAGVHEPEAMVVSTASPDGVPSARVVLMRGVDDAGFRFFTNYESRKGRELDANPRACATFHWHPPGRQVRVEGTVARLPREESERYFAARPRGHQVGAWASRQGAVIDGREALEGAYAGAARRFQGGPVPLPPYWGGYVLRPDVVEFWEGRTDRLHDRVMYLRGGDGWSRARLSP